MTLLLPAPLRRLSFLSTAALLFVLPPSALRADPPKEDAFLRDYAETRGFSLGRPVNATPTPNGQAVLFLRAKSGREPSQELYEFTVATGQTRRLLTPEDALKGAAEQLSPEEKARRERQRISVGGFTSFSISKDNQLVLLGLSGKLYVLRRADGTVAELAVGPGTVVDPKFSPDGKSVAYVRGYDVYVFNLVTGTEHPVTTGGTETVSHGLAEFVAQEEMARFSGYWWSPDSAEIIYQESDASQVESWYPADPAQPGVDPSRVFYPRPGKPNVAVRLGIAPATAPGDTLWFEWNHEKYPYLGKVTWKEVGPPTLTVLSRDQHDLALLKADTVKGKTTVLLTEHDDAWVNLEQDVPVWLDGTDGGGFLWASERTGWRNLEHRDENGQLKRDYHFGAESGFQALAGVAGGRFYGIYSGSTPYFPELDADWIDGRPRPDEDTLTGSDWSTARVEFGDCKTVYVVTEQSLTRLPRTVVRSIGDNKIVGELPSVAESAKLLPNVTVEFTGPGKDKPSGEGRGYFAAVVKPQDFKPDARQKYPVIVDVYGGPSHQQVVSSVGRFLLDQWLADQGFIVVAIDGRGTPGRGRDWERAIAGHFGSVPLDDQVDALKLLSAKHPELDLDRVGITGWSFGGYMSGLAVLRRPDVFKAAVAGAPVTDWLDYDTCYTERYLGIPGTPAADAAYQEGSLLTYAPGLSRPLLLIHGTADDNVYFRHSLKLSEALFRAGKEPDFLPLSTFTHMVPDPVVRTRLEERIVRYFQRHLGAPK